MDSIVKTLICLLWALWAGIMGWYCIQAARQITYVTLADGRRQVRRLPVLFRLLLPLAPNLRPFVETPRFARARQYAQRKLTAAGFEDLLSPQEFLALRFLVPGVVGTVLTLLCSLALHSIGGRVGASLLRFQFGWYAVFFLLTCVQPGMWLRRMLKQRRLQIQRALPFVLDLLTLSVEAGLDFMSALQKIVDRRELDALGEELIRVLREIQVGRTRREALREMSRRMDHLDIRAVVTALTQADEMGVSIGSILRILSDQMRNRRFQRAEKLANEAPVKLLFPLIAFIFPAVFLILLGPIIQQLLRQIF